jgi:hypothetical protein
VDKGDYGRIDESVHWWSLSSQLNTATHMFIMYYI